MCSDGTKRRFYYVQLTPWLVISTSSLHLIKSSFLGAMSCTTQKRLESRYAYHNDNNNQHLHWHVYVQILPTLANFLRILGINMSRQAASYFSLWNAFQNSFFFSNLPLQLDIFFFCCSLKVSIRTCFYYYPGFPSTENGFNDEIVLREFTANLVTVFADWKITELLDSL